jgi:hypothetical protein
MIFDFSNIRIESPFNIGLSIKAGQHFIVEDYLQKIFLQFCKDLNLSPTFLKDLPFENIFTDVEFNKQIPDDNQESFINKTFYPNLFKDIRKQENNRLDFYTKFCFTMDKSLTPEKTISGIYYGYLNLGNKPVLYYIWSDVQSIINLIKAT